MVLFSSCKSFFDFVRDPSSAMVDEEYKKYHIMMICKHSPDIAISARLLNHFVGHKMSKIAKNHIYDVKMKDPSI
jgi:hypothetical protein